MEESSRIRGSVEPSRHAVARYREHHRRSGMSDVRLAVGIGERVDAQLALTIVGRRPPRRKAMSVYVLAPDRRGLFVLVPLTRCSWKVVTYLRFGPAQLQFALSHWPLETCCHQPALATDPVHHSNMKEAA